MALQSIRKWFRKLAPWLLCCLLAGPAGTVGAAEFTVFAAVSLGNALEEVGKLHQARGGTRPRFSFAASSTLAKQIEAGAQAQVFISADEQWLDYLQQRGLLEPASRRKLLGNRLVLVVAAGNPLNVALDRADWLQALDRSGQGRIAVGDPAHVPAGRYAQQALEALGVWPAVRGRLARADNVRAALALVERGEALAGIVYETDALASGRVRVAARFDTGRHAPIVYPLALVAGQATPAARAFHRLLLTPEAGAIFRRHGFVVLPQ